MNDIHKFWPVGVGGGEGNPVYVEVGPDWRATDREPAPGCPWCCAGHKTEKLRKAGDEIVMTRERRPGMPLDWECRTQIVRRVIGNAEAVQYECRPGPVILYLPPGPRCVDCEHPIEPLSQPPRCWLCSDHACRIQGGLGLQMWVASVQQAMTEHRERGGNAWVCGVAQSGPFWQPSIWLPGTFRAPRTES
jgi:hypothetical protein